MRSSLFIRRRSRAVSLIELLICLAIISILTVISLAYQQGALDAGDIKFIAPKLQKTLRAMRGVSNNLGAIVTVEFIEDEPILNITVAKGDPVEPVTIDLNFLNNARQQELDLLTDEIRKKIEKHGEPYHYIGVWNLKDAGLIKRKLTFGEYEWPEGNDTPRTFTFIPHSEPQGGTVKFGTALAKAIISLDKGAVNWALD